MNNKKEVISMFRYNFFFVGLFIFFMRNRKKTTEHNTYTAYTCKYNKDSDCFSIIASRINIAITYCAKSNDYIIK